MTPEQFSQFLESNKKATAEAIEITVNGKIRNLTKLVEEHNTKHEADYRVVKEHIEATRPIIEAYKGFNTAGNLVKWVAGVGTAVGVLWIMIKGLLGR